MIYFGDNDDPMKGKPMWSIAHDFNKKSKELNGKETTVIRRRVTKTEPVALR